VLISEFLDSIWREVFVESGSADIELINHIFDEWVIFHILEHGLSISDTLLIHPFWPSVPTTTFIHRHNPILVDDRNSE
jgi:hypothetical protein